MKNKYVIIHGHFYQPPRENPWTGEIERQDSAHPFNDWNERIAAECYTPNTASRVLNEKSLINDIINNYEYFSFNFGATLLQWLEKHAKDTYHKIIEADQRSVKKHNGHGNALAQVYNHVIMPLANDDDKRTQIEWGIKDFEHRFGRKAEGIWLAETAINQRTVEILMEYNIKFIILSPHQADKIRAFNSSSWIDVSSGLIDTRVPYRIFQKDGKGKNNPDQYLDVFFYNAGLSSAVGFEHLLRDSVRFADSIQAAFDAWSSQPQAVFIATDGESYGHHEKNADMCFSSFVSREIHHRDFEITNLGHYLEMNPPQFEVILKSGPNGEGTAWSCAHGVGRWSRDCGCSDGGLFGWNQKWRTPFREAMNYLRDECNKVYQDFLGPYCKDLKRMRNDYITVMLNPQQRDAFLKKHIKYRKKLDDPSMVFKLLDAQHFCQLIFTSCAWFFADISRLEPVQNLKYAARAIEILKTFTSREIGSNFIAILQKANSNVHEVPTGKDVYEKYVMPSVCHPEMIIGNFAIESFIYQEVKERKIFFYTIDPVLHEKKEDDSTPVFKGMVKLTNDITGYVDSFIYYLFVPSYREIRCYILNSDESIEFNISPVDTLEDTISSLAHHHFYTIKDLIGYNREHLIQLAMKEEMQRLKRTFNEIYRKNIDLLETLKQYDLDLPNVLKEICSYALTHTIHKDIKRLNKKHYNKRSYSDYTVIKDLFLYAQHLGLKINPTMLEEDINQVIISKMQGLRQKLNKDVALSIVDFLSMGEELGLHLNQFKMQNIIYQLLQEDMLYIKPEKNIKTSLESISIMVKIAEKLSFNADKFAKKTAIDF